MKVMHILDSLNRGGAEMLALDLCRNARGHNLDLTFAATGGGDLEDDFREAGVDFVRLNRRLPIDLKLCAGLRRVIKERGIEVVHVQQEVEAVHAYLATRACVSLVSASILYCEAKNRWALNRSFR